MDTDAIGSCLPDAAAAAVGPDRYEVELGVTVAAIAGSFKGTVALEDKIPPHSLHAGGRGQRPPGIHQGAARA